MDTIDEVIVANCIACDTELDSDDVVLTRKGDPVCQDCIIVCEKCEDVLTVDDPYNTVEDELWCERCTHNDAHWCDMGEHYFTGYQYSAADTSDTMCEACFERNASYCENCDEYFVNGCDYSHDEDDDVRIVHDYSYRPDPVFRSSEGEDTRLYFGIEVETEARGEDWGIRRTAAEYAGLILESERLAYLKSDGSLSCGFELVTHPMSHSYFMNNAGTLWDTIHSLKTNYNMMAWGTKTCGLHIHISRNGFNGGSHQHRFLQLVYNNKDFYEIMAGRSSSHWAKFDDIYDHDGKKTFRHKLNREGSDRYAAVNTNNRNTLEMRIFRGSLNTGYIKACIDLAHASVEFTRTMSVPEVRNNKLDCINLIQYIRDRAELYSALNARLGRLSDAISQIERKEHVSAGSKFSE